MHEAVEILKLTNMNITKINFMTFAECRGINPTSHPGNQRKLIIDYRPRSQVPESRIQDEAPIRPLAPNKSKI